MSESMSQDEVKRLMAGEYVPKRPSAQAVKRLDRLEITIPLPPRSTHPNARSRTWHAKARGAKKQLQDAYIAALDALKGTKPRWEAVTVTATFHRHKPNDRQADSDNLAAWLKASIDGLQAAGVIENDRGVTLLPPVQLLGKDAGGETKVVLTIEPHNPGASQ